MDATGRDSPAELAAIKLHMDQFGRMVLTMPGGKSVTDVLPVRCFPFSAPDAWISLCDEHGLEAALIADPNALTAEARMVLDQELDRRDFVPVVSRIFEISPEREPSIWRVETDRGETNFTLASEDHVRRLTPRGVLIADARGVRYRILDERHLDRRSRRLLGRYL